MFTSARARNILQATPSCTSAKPFRFTSNRSFRGSQCTNINQSPSQLHSIVETLSWSHRYSITNSQIHQYHSKQSKESQFPPSPTSTNITFDSQTKEYPDNDINNVNNNVNNDNINNINNYDNNGTTNNSLYDKFLNKYGAAASTASIDYNRALIVPPAITTHICLGGIYSWSLFNGPLTRELGVVTSVAGDWSFSHVVPAFSTVVLCHGICGAVLGKWTDKVGPRVTLSLGALCYGGGTILSGLGVSMHSLPLIYLGFGVLGGIGHGLCYVSPISTLLKWFPDKPGLASGLAIMGLGGGAIGITPLIDKLLAKNFQTPTFVGTDTTISNIANSATIISNDEGQHFIDASSIIGTNTDTSSNLTEIVHITKHELLQSGFSESIQSKIVDNGWYLVDHMGSTGVGPTLMTIGAGYLGIISLSSLFLKLPHPSLSTANNVTNTANNINNSNALDNNKIDNNLIHNKPLSLTMEEAMKTPQFWLMWFTLFSCSTAGMGIISTAKTMMSEVFGQNLPHIVTASFASTYVMAISASNLIGRLGWGTVSDKIGRFATFTTFGTVGCVLYASIPLYIHSSGGDMGIMPLIAFYGSTLLLFSFFGGGFAVMPAYLADKFGTQHVGGIWGKMMFATACSGVLGPLLVTKFREKSMNDNIINISEKIWNIDNGMTFDKLLVGTKTHEINESNIDQFDLTKIEHLIENNTLTVAKLMNCVDKIENEMGINLGSIVDPTPFLYDSTMYAMSGVMATCAIANLAIRQCKPTRAQTI